MNKEQFINSVVKIASEHGHGVETNKFGLRQIDFVHKKLHEGHLAKLYPEILQSDARIAVLIDRVAPGRTCAHKPMRKIIAEIINK